MRITRFLNIMIAITITLAGCTARPATSVPTQPADQTPASRTATLVSSPAPGSENTSTVPPSATPTTEDVPSEPTGQAAPGGGAIQFTSRAGQPLADVSLKIYQPGTYPVTLDRLPLDLAGLGNPGVIKNLTPEQKQFISRNGFVVIPSGDKQYKELRKSVSIENGQPYYLTVDAAYHALHITFNDLLESLESSDFRPILARLVKAVLEKVNEYASASVGQPIAEDAALAQAYLGVGLKLLEPTQALDPALEEKIAPQIAQIMSYKGREKSALIPGFEDDYGAYRPVGHYAGKPELEQYFRAMTWFGRVAFKFKDAENPDLKPSRAPLLITLALRESLVDIEPAYKVWSSLYEITDFMVGPSDDPGPVELNALMEQVYGPTPGLADLADDGKWQQFLARTDDLPAPRINSTFASFSVTQAAERDWRFMGQRFTPDAFIFQNLIFDKVGTQTQPRRFPMGLDVAAAFGSQPALQALETAGETKYAKYPQQMTLVQKIIAEQPEVQWLNRFYTAWLYAFRPNVAAKGEGYPPYMRTAAWGYKDVNAMLGSWAELKHDTVLYSKMPEMMGGGGPPMSGPAPAYVEPNPDVFYRLAYAAQNLAEGLGPKQEHWNMMGWEQLPAGEEAFRYNPGSYLGHLKTLAESFNQFGDIAARELQDEPLTPTDFEVLQTCLEYKECLDHGMYTNNPPELEPIPVIAAVSGADDRVLEVGVGKLNRIYVAVPLEGKLQIAQGGVFSYYEFTQPHSHRLTDQAWRERLEKGQVTAPAWTSAILLPGGKPADVLAFRVGDVYIITEAGGNPPLNMRAGPSRNEKVVSTLEAGAYITILEGPRKSADGTWWKVGLNFGDVPGGWVLENPDWYERSHP